MRHFKARLGAFTSFTDKLFIHFYIYEYKHDILLFNKNTKNKVLKTLSFELNPWDFYSTINNSIIAN